jgi:hypothetical protein
MSEMSSRTNENVGRFDRRTKISGENITGKREIFPKAKKKASLLRAMLV